jgi:diacylglycerol kinase (ATP)
MGRKVYVIANPAAGQGNFDIKALNSRFSKAGVEWEVLFTKSYGDGACLAQRALDEGADVVAAFGGDGTVAEVGGALAERGVPLAILPGGTANVMSVELGIPSKFVDACELLCYEVLTTRSIDLGLVDKRPFLLRLSLGLEARMVEGADRSLKDRLGTLAYALSALKALTTPEVVRYDLDLDGHMVSEEGIACIIANSANLGSPNLYLAPDVSVSDGLLDVFLVNDANLPTVMSLIGGILNPESRDVEAEELGVESELPRNVRHWQARQIHLHSVPPRSVQADGEMIGDTPKQIGLIAGALDVVVPPPHAGQRQEEETA